ncbi:MAG: response regulator [Candidatus Omnitrophota bacterium]
MQSEAKKTILVVDDEAGILEYLKNILSRHNYKVVVTSKGKDAFDLALSKKPDLIILDIVMPDLSGGEVASLLSKNPKTSNIPILFLTGIMNKSEARTMERCGKHHIMAKPVIVDELILMIERLIPPD